MHVINQRVSSSRFVTPRELKQMRLISDGISLSIDINTFIIFVNRDEFSPCIKKDQRLTIKRYPSAATVYQVF